MDIKITRQHINSLFEIYEGDESYYDDSYISHILQCENIYKSDECFDQVFDAVEKTDPHMHMKIAELLVEKFGDKNTKYIIDIGESYKK